LPETLVGNLSDEPSPVAMEPSSQAVERVPAGAVMSSPGAVEPSPGDVEPSPVTSDFSLSSVKKSLSSVISSPCDINSSPVNVDLAKILTWVESEELCDLVSHYVVYQLTSEYRSICTILPSQTAATLSDQSDPSVLILGHSCELSLCVLESSRVCVSCNVDGSAQVSDVLCFDRRSDGYWQCIGLTPSSCFRITTPVTNLSKFAVLPVSQNNETLHLVKIDTSGVHRVCLSVD